MPKGKKKKKILSALLWYASALKTHSNIRLVSFQFIGFEMDRGKVTQAHTRTHMPINKW